jgi:hypothetical protein
MLPLSSEAAQAGGAGGATPEAGMSGSRSPGPSKPVIWPDLGPPGGDVVPAERTPTTTAAASTKSEGTPRECPGSRRSQLLIMSRDRRIKPPSPPSLSRSGRNIPQYVRKSRPDPGIADRRRRSRRDPDPPVSRDSAQARSAMSSARPRGVISSARLPDPGAGAAPSRRRGGALSRRRRGARGEPLCRSSRWWPSDRST